MLWIDGRARSVELRAGISADVLQLGEEFGRAPKLGVLLIGDDPASELYVRRKEQAAASVGISTVDARFPADVSEAHVLRVIEEWNRAPDVDGILLQLPLPPHLVRDRLLAAIAIEKDIDGLHPTSQGWLFRGRPAFEPCTPKGILDLIQVSTEKLGRQIKGAHSVVIGRSILVGRPLAAMLTNADCTVTLCHSQSQNLAEISQTGDILVVAAGRPGLVDARFVKPGAIVVDVGIHRQPNGTIVGDVHQASVKDVAGALTPVPGGVGPMTICMLLQNTLTAARHRLEGPPIHP